MPEPQMRTAIERSRTVHANQLLDLVEDLRRASGREAEELTTEVIHATTEHTADLARHYAPRVTGELINSIGTQTGPGWGRVRATAEHAAFVEFGTWSHNIHEPKTGTYEIRPVRAKALAFQSGGRTVFAKKVEHPGIPAQRPIGRAADDVVDEFAWLLGSVGVQLIVRSV